jgi:hypothetical protein
VSRLTIVLDDTLRAASTARAEAESRDLSTHVRALMAADAGVEDGTAKRGRPCTGRYVYRAVYQHSGRDAGLVGRGGCKASTAHECRRLASGHYIGAGRIASGYIVRRYRVPL